MGQAHDEDADAVEMALRQYEALFETLPQQLGRIRELIASNASLATRRLGYDLTAEVHGLLVRVNFDARLRTQDALERAEDLEREGRSEQGRRLRRSAQRILVSLESYRDTLDEILEQGRREESTRIERNQRLLGYALAALAGLTAMPLLTGEHDPAGLQATLARLPRPFDGMAGVAAALHPWLTLLSAIGALAIVALLVVLLTRFGVRRVEKGTDPVALVGRTMPLMRRLAAEEKTDPAADREVSRALADVIGELVGTDQRGRTDADEALDAFLVRAELGTRRPVPVPWLEAATLLRYRLDPQAPGRWLGAREYAQILRSHGVDRPVEEINRRAAAQSDAPPEEFARRIGLRD